MTSIPESAKRFQKLAIEADLSKLATSTPTNSSTLDESLQTALLDVISHSLKTGLSWSLTDTGELLVGPKDSEMLILTSTKSMNTDNPNGLNWMLFKNGPGFWLLDSWGEVSGVDTTEIETEDLLISPYDTPSPISSFIQDWLSKGSKLP